MDEGEPMGWPVTDFTAGVPGTIGPQLVVYFSSCFGIQRRTDGFSFSWTTLNRWLPRFPLIDVGRRRSVEAQQKCT